MNVRSGRSVRNRPIKDHGKSRSAKCDRRAFAVCWSTIPTIDALILRSSALLPMAGPYSYLKPGATCHCQVCGRSGADKQDQ